MRRFLLLLLAATGLSASAMTMTPPERPVPPEFFGLHIHRATRGTPWPTVPFGSWRLMATWSEWPWIEPEKGKWNFTIPDQAVALAQKHGVEILMPLAYTPAWASARPAEKSFYGPGNAAEPANLDDWRTYVRTVATRYRGKVRYYEIWNEPNLPGFYTGSTETMVTLAREAYRIIHETDPTARVVSPSITKDYGVSWLDSYLALGGGKYADIIGYHFYTTPGTPEQAVPVMEAVKKVMKRHGAGGKELWDTENGWLIANHKTTIRTDATGFRSRLLSDDEAAAYIARSYILHWAAGVDRLFWYAWDNNEMGLTEEDYRTVKPAAAGYARIREWLEGSTMTACSRDGNGTWTASVRRAGGGRGWIVWHPSGTSDYPVPPGALRATALNGEERAVKPGGKLTVGEAPILLEGGK